MDALGWPLPVSEKFDMRRDGIALMRAQRATWNSTPGATIGGYIQAVNVSQYHLATTILHRWPDAVGCCPQEYAP